MICMALELGTSEPFTHAGYANKSMGIAGVWSVFMFSWFFSWSYGPGQLVLMLLDSHSSVQFPGSTNRKSSQ